MRRVVVSLLTVSSLLLPVQVAWAEASPSPPPAETAVDDSLVAQETAMAERRREQLAWHQGLALASLLCMAGTGILGQVLHSQKDVVLDVSGWTATHTVLAGATTLLYGGAATLALTAPPPTQPALDRGGFDPIVLHRGLTCLHAATLGATVTLGLMALFDVKGLAPTHQVLAWTTTGLMAVSGGLIVFNF